MRKYFQGGDSMLPSQYRPLTIPSNILRILTKRMCNRMTEVVETHGMLNEAQFGFRKDRSTIDAIFVLNTLFTKAKQKR